MSVTEAHRKLGHISISSIKHAVLKQLITGIDVDFASKFEFCEACAKVNSERGMRTRAEGARALLLASGLPRFLWEEAIKHQAWLQDRTPARALNGKTPYEMGSNKKPHLAGIQEFGAAAYVKDLTAGKLDARARKGRFVGYDSESKGYRIYWPEKRSVTIERNVVFNQDDRTTHEDTAIIYGKVLSEGKKEKVIHNPQNNVKNIEKPENDDSKTQQTQEKDSELHQSPKTTNSVLFPMSDDSQNQPELEPEDNSQQYGRGQRARHEKGHYRAMTEGLVAAVTAIVKEPPEDDEDKTQTPAEVFVEPEEPEDDYELPPDIALMEYTHLDPKTLDEALRGPNAKEWEETLQYEINQLEKLRTWVVEDLPPGQTAIPCSEVVQVKRGPNSEVQSYRVRIVAGGHKQVEGVNYTETFSAAAKMPTVRVVLANAAHQDWEIEHVDVKSAYRSRRSYI
jgi:Reverse transcriptase (RNA-dependent DNA polymerase)